MSVKCLACSRIVKGSEIATGSATVKKIAGVLCSICGNCAKDGLTFSNYVEAKKVHKRTGSRWEISKTEYKRWLNSKNHNEIIGTPRSIDSCPISTFYLQTKDMLSVSVTEHEIIVVPRSGLPSESMKTRRWQKDFTRLVDKEGESYITVQRCLNILEETRLTNINGDSDDE